MIIDSEETERRVSIADEHERLIEQIACIDRRLRAVPLDADGIIREVRKVLDLTRAHFEHEEAAMAQSHYGDLAAHKRDHDYLRTSLIHFVEQVEHRKAAATPDLGLNLKSWLEFHIRKFDNPYFELMTHRT